MTEGAVRLDVAPARMLFGKELTAQPALGRTGRPVGLNNESKRCVFI